MDQNPEIKLTVKCKCGTKADFIKDYWVAEACIKKEKTYDNTIVADLENTCGIIRRRYCKIPDISFQLCPCATIKRMILSRHVRAIISLGIGFVSTLTVGRRYLVAPVIVSRISSKRSRRLTSEQRIKGPVFCSSCISISIHTTQRIRHPISYLVAVVPSERIVPVYLSVHGETMVVISET